MLAAYHHMRGPAGLSRGELIEWVERRAEEEEQTGPTTADAREGNCQDLVDDLRPYTADSPPPENDPRRREVFRVPRPQYEHIRASPSSSSRALAEGLGQVPWQPARDQSRGLLSIGERDVLGSSFECHLDVSRALQAERDDDSFYSDREGPSGEDRISPCTFRLWAQGCDRNSSANGNEDVGTENPTLAAGFQGEGVTHDAPEARQQTAPDDQTTPTQRRTAGYIDTDNDEEWDLYEDSLGDPQEERPVLETPTDTPRPVGSTLEVVQEAEEEHGTQDEEHTAPQIPSGAFQDISSALSVIDEEEEEEEEEGPDHAFNGGQSASSTGADHTELRIPMYEDTIRGPIAAWEVNSNNHLSPIPVSLTPGGRTSRASSRSINGTGRRSLPVFTQASGEDSYGANSRQVNGDRTRMSFPNPLSSNPVLLEDPFTSNYNSSRVSETDVGGNQTEQDDGNSGTFVPVILSEGGAIFTVINPAHLNGGRAELESNSFHAQPNGIGGQLIDAEQTSDEAAVSSSENGLSVNDNGYMQLSDVGGDVNGNQVQVNGNVDDALYSTQASIDSPSVTVGELYHNFLREEYSSRGGEARSSEASVAAEAPKVPNAPNTPVTVIPHDHPLDAGGINGVINGGNHSPAGSAITNTEQYARGDPMRPLLDRTPPPPRPWFPSSSSSSNAARARQVNGTDDERGSGDDNAPSPPRGRTSSTIIERLRARRRRHRLALMRVIEEFYSRIGESRLRLRASMALMRRAEDAADRRSLNHSQRNAVDSVEGNVDNDSNNNSRDRNDGRAATTNLSFGDIYERLMEEMTELQAQMDNSEARIQRLAAALARMQSLERDVDREIETVIRDRVAQGEEEANDILRRLQNGEDI